MKTIVTKKVESATETLDFFVWGVDEGVRYLDSDEDLEELALACGVEVAAVKIWLLNFNAIREAVQLDLENLHRRLEKLEERYG